MLFRILNTLFLSILFLTFSFTEDDRELFVISGYVLLEDSLDAGGTHEGVTISVKSLLDNPPSLVESSESGEDGFYSITVNPGFYLVEWTKDGYVPLEQGDVGLYEDMEMEDVTLIPGSVLEVAGDVSGNWTTSYQYWVTENITVPEGDSLIIDAGVRVKFFEGTGLVANGRLEVNGTEEDHVLFTSKLPIPLPGDWDNIELYSENNVISYLDYEYADDGFTGDNASGSSFDHLHMVGTLSLAANGIYLTNSSNMSFTNNHISVAGEYGIFSENSPNSVVNNNEINGNYSTAAINMDYCHDCLFDGNTITNKPYNGFRVRWSDHATFTNNTIEADEYGFSCQDGTYYTFENNTITSFDEYGIYFQCSEYSVVNYNNLTGSTENSGWKRAIHNSCSAYSEVNYNTIYYSDVEGGHVDQYGIEVHDSEIIGNNIEIYLNSHNACCTWSSDAVGIRADRSVIEENTIYIRDPAARHHSIGIHSWNNNSDNRSEIKNNTITAIGYTKAIAADYADIENNIIDTGGENNHDWAIETGHYTVVRNNQITGPFDSGINLDNQISNIIENNYIEFEYHGLYANSSDGGHHIFQNNTLKRLDTYANAGADYWMIRVTEQSDSVTVINNTMEGDYGSGVYIHDNVNTVLLLENNIINVGYYGLRLDNAGFNVNHNLIKLAFGYRGVEITGESQGELVQNTLIGNGGDYAIYAIDYSTPEIMSNIIQDFQVGIHIDNNLVNNELKSNDLWMITGSNFSGTAMHPMIGSYISENDNGDVVDIFGNMSLDPLFTDESNQDYSLVSISPCINAGNPAVTDPDGTVGDMGAFYHHFYILLDHAPYGNTIDTENPYTINASAYATAGDAVEVNLYYSTDGDDFETISMTNSEDNNFTANIPNQPMDTHVQYYLEVTDGTNTLTDPYGAPENSHSFDVTLVDEFTVLDAYSRPDGSIYLYWEAPSYLDGVNPTSLSIYRSDLPGVTQDDLIAGDIDISELTYYDADIIEGNTYYYRIGTTGDVNGQSYIELISNEAQVLSNMEEVVNITGQVNLEGSDDNSGVLVKFLREYPENIYTASSDEEGNFALQIPQSIYNINFSKFGWQPYDLNNQLIDDDTSYDITLEEGYAAYVQGGISGTWSAENLYFVEGDITVIGDDTLTIEAGTRIKFMGEYQFSVEGVLIAEGDSLNHIEFTSGQTIPMPGDWGILSLHSPGNILSYVDIRYAGNGISGEDIDGSIFDNCSIAEIPYWADDARLNCHGIEAENCLNCVFSNNSVEGDIWEGIMVEHDGSGSVFTGNMINTHETMVGLAVGEGDGLIFSDNVIMADGWGSAILVEEGSNISITDNIITGYKGIQVPFGENLNISGNDITSTNRGVHITTSGTGLSVTDNTINSSEISIYASGIEGGMITGNSCEGSSGSWAIDMSSCDDCLFEANTVNYPSGHGIKSNSSSTTTMENNTINIGGSGIYAESGNNLEITNNTITGFNSNGIRFESTSNTSIHNNSLVSTPDGDSNNYGIYNGNTNNYQNMVYANDIHILNADNTVEGIRASRADVYDNSITIDNGDNGNYGIRGEYNTIYNNMITQTSQSNGYAIYNTGQYSSSEIYGNQIELSGASGIKGKLLHIHDNTMTGSDAIGIDITGNQEEISIIENNTVSGQVRITNYAVIDMHHNLVISTTGGLEIYNMAGGHFYNNTFVGAGSAIGLHIHDFALEQSGQTLKVENNIFSGFDIGVNVENEITSIRFNNIYNSSTSDFIGAGLPPSFGSTSQENYNADAADFYMNIFLDPLFVYADVDNYNLLLGSPCINAGHPDLDQDGDDSQNDDDEDDQDPDGTALDIGAFYRDAEAPSDSLGCTDSIACNYNSGATQDNGGCTYPTTWYWDEDGDGLGVEESQVDSCDDEVPDNFVDNADDLEPDCATNDTDDCGICAGGNADMDCNGDCFGEALVDECEVCSGGDTGQEPNSDMDCNADCFGDAYLDGCSDCVGGSTGLEACPEDCNEVFGGDAFWDDCQACSGGNTEHEANSDMDCAGICYGDNIGDSFDGCCLEGSIDDCGQCDGNGWDMCGEPPGNYARWGYGVHDITITDIPDDQGSWVLLSFIGSYHDSDTLRSTEIYTIERWDGAYWNSLHSLSAYGSDYYYTEARTAVDSLSTTDDGMTLFRIVANMDEGNFENVEEAWGYSVDNISPIVPTQMSASSTANNVTLSWNYEMESDFQYHQVTSLDDINYTTENNHNFVLGETDNQEHWVNTVDTHGNVSENSHSLMSKSLHIGANLISFNVLPEDSSITNVMASIEGVANGVIGEGVAANYMSGAWQGSLTYMSPLSGYWVKVNDADALLLAGIPTERDMVYSLHSGANLISYPYRYPTPIAEALPEGIGCDITGIIGEGVAATCIDGIWMGSLDVAGLEGSYGYWFIAEEAMEITFNGCDEQECASLSRQSQNIITNPEGYEFTQSTKQAFYFLESIENIELGDWILSFNGDEVIGARQWQGSIIDVPAMGDDGSDYTKGYIEAGSVPSFKILRDNEFINLEGDIPSWDNNQLFMVSSLTEAVALPETFSLDRAYPNPFNPKTTLSFALPVISNVLLEVYDINGRLINELIKGNMDAGYHSVIWNADNNASGVYFVKMVAGDFVNTQKLMLVK